MLYRVCLVLYYLWAVGVLVLLAHAMLILLYACWRCCFWKEVYRHPDCPTSSPGQAALFMGVYAIPVTCLPAYACTCCALQTPFLSPATPSANSFLQPM
jgi:hypothetical protein